jgi:hypothetical protein
MFGKPEDTEGECNAHLYLGDDFDDNHATIRCQLPEGHEGPHVEWFYRGEGKVTISWDKDERARADLERAEREARRMERIREWLESQPK